MARGRVILLSIAVVAAIVVVVDALWLVAASYLFLMMTGGLGRVSQPWMAWLNYAIKGPNWWEQVMLGLSGLEALVIMLAASLPLLRWCWGRRRAKPLLFGRAAWAGQRQMNNAGITSDAGTSDRRW